MSAQLLDACPFRRRCSADGCILKIAASMTGLSVSGVKKTLRTIDNRGDVDIIIALGMAKEGFHRIWCDTP
ncbi:hypothetical protein [Bradyrhizobium macuxiense]|uniref:hypothetical protein n=1 Tax=Bradyrhizobium macuxiense TaxID=1755647 RepID=UPI00142EA82A|nr:hypothetical protein [Bradyrhizobium macuxiense]